MRSIGLLLIILLGCSQLVAQNNEATSTTQQAQQSQQEEGEMAHWGYGNEILGAAHFWSILLSYRFNRYFAAQTGFSYILVPGERYNADYFIIPILGSYMVGFDKHLAEIQLGTLIVPIAELGFRTADRPGTRATTTSKLVVPIGSLGYRYQPHGAGWFLRVSMYLIYGFDPKKEIWNVKRWPGLSVGRMF